MSAVLPGQGRLVALWTLLGTLGVAAVFPYFLASNPSLIAKIPVPLPLFLTAQIAQTGLLLALGCWLGLRLGQHVGLDSPLARALVFRTALPARILHKLSLALASGIGLGIALVALDRASQPWMPPHGPIAAPPAAWKGLLASFYGGITEELLLRLFLMTLIVWMIWKFQSKRSVPPPSYAYWAAIVISAILFGVGHLPAVHLMWPLTPVVIIRTICLNAAGGAVFGLLYWKLGLEFAMSAHFAADVVLHVIMGA